MSCGPWLDVSRTKKSERWPSISPGCSKRFSRIGFSWMPTGFRGYLAFVAVNSPPTFIGCTFTEPEIFSADSSVPL